MFLVCRICCLFHQWISIQQLSIRPCFKLPFIRAFTLSTLNCDSEPLCRVHLCHCRDHCSLRKQVPRPPCINASILPFSILCFVNLGTLIQIIIFPSSYCRKKFHVRIFSFYYVLLRVKFMEFYVTVPHYCLLALFSGKSFLFVKLRHCSLLQESL